MLAANVATLKDWMDPLLLLYKESWSLTRCVCECVFCPDEGSSCQFNSCLQLHLSFPVLCVFHSESIPYPVFCILMSVADITSFSPRMTQLFLWLWVRWHYCGCWAGRPSKTALRRFWHTAPETTSCMHGDMAVTVHVSRIGLKIHKVNKPYF